MRGSTLAYLAAFCAFTVLTVLHLTSFLDADHDDTYSTLVPRPPPPLPPSPTLVPSSPGDPDPSVFLPVPQPPPPSPEEAALMKCMTDGTEEPFMKEANLTSGNETMWEMWLNDDVRRMRCAMAFNRLPVRNTERFPLAKRHITVTAITHKRPFYLNALFTSLRSVRGVQNMLLVVSHDAPLLESLDISRSVDFMPVKILVNPYSREVQRHSFLAYKAHYGLKLHNWWLWSTIFDREEGIEVDDVCYVEEDHLVTVDFYESLVELLKMKNQICPRCFGVNMGLHGRKPPYDGLYNLERTSSGNMGMTFNRSMWQILRKESRHFCRWGSWNWDLTFASMDSYGIKPDEAVSIQWSCVIHIGHCGGLHGSKAFTCNITRSYGTFLENFSNPLSKRKPEGWWEWLRHHGKDKPLRWTWPRGGPPSLLRHKPPNPNKDFLDPRAQDLCLSYANITDDYNGCIPFSEDTRSCQFRMLHNFQGAMAFLGGERALGSRVSPFAPSP